MGISGLLPLLKDIQVPRKIEDFHGKRLAVDAYVWLHKGAFGCAEDLVKGRKTTRFVDYAMYRVGMLRHHGITPYVVFDGGPLPAKRGTEDSRAKSRADNLARAQAFEAQGRLKDARDCYTKCIDITPEMAFQLIKALRAENVDYVVAPYEADAQLCFLEREGFVDGVITEDSDLLVFGCKTVIFKLDKDGTCVSIDGTRMAMVRELPMHGWTHLEFRRMAMLSGCDYLPSIHGIGLKKAHRMLRRYKTVEKSLQAIRLEGSLSIPPDYADAFSKAELAFLYQRVFCPEKRRLVTLTELPDTGLSAGEEKWVGRDVEVEVARGMATGDLHPETRQPIEDQWPDFKPTRGMFFKTNPGSKPLGSNKTPPTGLRSGTLDGLFRPIKRAATAPNRLPRLGEMTSGPTRLSNINTGLSRRVSEHMESPSTEVKTSKFFGKKGPQPEPEPEPEIDEPDLELQWEESFGTTVASPKTERVRSPTPETLRSPSPALSTLHPTPARTDAGDRFTSPVSVYSGFSTPPCSTPPRPKLEKQRPEPSSPSPTPHVLVAPSSQTLTCATVATTRAPSSDQTVDIPESSPLSRLQIPRPRSSDSAHDDEIVTPSNVAQFPRHRHTPGLAKRPRQDEEDDGEAAERARKVAEGWRQKFALGGGSSPGPAPPPRPRSRPRTSMPITAGAGILTSRSVNIPDNTKTFKLQAPITKSEHKAKPESKVKPEPMAKPLPMTNAPRRGFPHPPRSTTPSHKPTTNKTTTHPVTEPANPCGLTWTALERFRFSRA